MSATLRVGLIGAGEMGRPLVDRLLDAGHPVAVYARRTEVRDDLAAAGVEVVDDAESLAAGRDVVVLYVYSDEQVRALGPGVIDAMDRGSLLVVHTTGSPATATDLAERASAKGVGFVDAPGSGGGAGRGGGAALRGDGPLRARGAAHPALLQRGQRRHDMAAAMGSAAQLVAAAGQFIHKDVVVARALADGLEIDLGPVTDQVLARTQAT